MSKYQVTVSRRDEWGSQGRPVRDSILDTDDLQEAIKFEIEHGGIIERTSDFKSLAADGTWV